MSDFSGLDRKKTGMREHELTGQVLRYLEGLGYHASLFETEVRTALGERVDIVVHDRDAPRIIVDIKTSEEFPKTVDSSKLRFDPHVRKVQSYANSLNAPFFLLTNGEIYLWFRTDDSGRPLLISDPVLPTMSASEVSSHLTKDSIVRKLKELQTILYNYGSSASTDELALIIYAKLLSERGDHRLQTALITSNYNSDFFSHIELPDNLLRDAFFRRYYEHVFEALDQIAFMQTRARDLLSAIDEVIIRKQALKETPPRIPRWLSDLLVRLSGIQAGDSILDMYSTYGDILAALLMSQPSSRYKAFLGVCPNTLSILWANIQRLILRSPEGAAEFIIDSRPYSDFWPWGGFPEPILMPR